MLHKPLMVGALLLVLPAAANELLPFEHPEQICEMQSPDVYAPGEEKERIALCVPEMDQAVRERVASILVRRKRAQTDPGLNRFIAVGASATRNMYYLTGFGRDQYTVSPDWGFLRRTIEHFSGSGKQRPFLNKRATVSGTSAGAWVYGGKRCKGCPAKLDAELDRMGAAFAVLMFGTNNVFWRFMKGHERHFMTRVADSFADPGCVHRTCLPPWAPGELIFPKGATPNLMEWVRKTLETKRKRFRSGYVRLIERLIAKDVVPVLTTIPPMPRRWLDEDSVWVFNEEIRELAAIYSLPLVDLWCALNPLVMWNGQVVNDWTHPVMTSGKGIADDRYHPSHHHAFDIADEHLVHGYNARNVLTLLRLHTLRDLVAELDLDQPENTTALSPSAKLVQTDRSL